MKNIDAIKLAIQSLGRIKFRSFLTIISVSIGISAVVLFVSLGLGLQKITTEQIANTSALTTITVGQRPETASQRSGPPITDESLEDFRKIKNVKRVSATANVPANVYYGNTSTGAMIYSVNPKDQDLEVGPLKSGTIIQPGQKETIITSVMASTISVVPEDVIGKELRVKFFDTDDEREFKSTEIIYTIVGIENNDTASIAYVPQDYFYFKNNLVVYNSARVSTNTRQNIEAAKKDIENLQYQAATIKDLIDQIDKIFLLVKIVLGLIGSIGFLVAFLGIINTLMISFLERTHEIGIMKAIGAKNSDIKKMFWYESGIIGFAGGLLGVAYAYLFGWVFNSVLNYFVEKNGSARMDVFVTPLLFCIVMILFSVVIAIIAGMYPTKRAQKLSPIDAIRQ